MFKKRSKSPGPSKSRLPDLNGEPPVPTPSKSFTFRRAKDAKKSITSSVDFSPRPESTSFSSYDVSTREKPLPEPNEYQVLQESVDDVKESTTEPQSVTTKLYRMGTDVLLKANDTYVAETGYVKTAQTFGKNMVNAISQADSGLLNTAKEAVSHAINNSSVIEHAIHIADNLADLGKTLPFISPAFVLLKVIMLNYTVSPNWLM